LNRKITWFQPSRLAQGRYNWTNNSDLIVYFTKPSNKKPTFNLDDVRVPQLVDSKQRSRVENVPSVKDGKYGKTKYNQLGKNPGNVWTDIKQLTYKSKELISREFLNTIQKPESLIERIVKASSNEDDLVLDPFSGLGTTFAVCKRLKRRFIGFEINPKYVEITKKRCGIE
jgi:DNA modification methylase